MSIEVKNLLKQYGGQKAVNHISFKVNKGEIVGFLGPNGAGKSTTMKILTGYLQPDAGNTLVAGIDVQLDPLKAKAVVGYLPESNPLYYDMYIREYLDFVAGVHQLKNRKEKIEATIARVGLGPERGKQIGQLSKGYKQRVGLAAALIHDPEVLILDEPTTGLDPNQIIEIREVIRQLGKQKTVLFSSHILQEVEAICDRVIIINQGNLVADDTLSNMRQQQASAWTVRVSFKEPIEKDWLNQLTDVRGIRQQENSEWEIDTNDPEITKQQILQLALQHKLNIVSLQSGGQSLEEIFRTLTAGETKQPATPSSN